MKKKAHAIIDKFADRGLRSLAAARQVSFFFGFPIFLGVFFRYAEAMSPEVLIVH